MHVACSGDPDRFCDWPDVQVEASLQPISRFQAAAVGSNIYIHTHRSLDDIVVLDVGNPDRPQLNKVSVSSTTGNIPSARYS